METYVEVQSVDLNS